MRRPLVIYDFATPPFWISYIWGKFCFLFYQCSNLLYLPVPLFPSLNLFCACTYMYERWGEILQKRWCCIHCCGSGSGFGIRSDRHHICGSGLWSVTRRVTYPDPVPDPDPDLYPFLPNVKNDKLIFFQKISICCQKFWKLWHLWHWWER